MKLRFSIPFSILALAVFIFTMIQGCVTEDDPVNIGVNTGDELPQFTVRLDNGETVSTSSLRGKIVVIEFFNTGCRDCQEGLPAINQLYEEYQENPKVVIFAISREENSESIEKFWEKHNFSLPYSPQSDRTVYNLFATTGIPRTYITDETGKIIAAFGDSDIPDFNLLKSVVDSLIRLSYDTDSRQSSADL